MSNQLAKVPSIDPEFAAEFAKADAARPVRTLPECEPAVINSDEDPLIALKRIAERNMQSSRKSSDCEDGFDRIENDVSNVVKTCWDFITR